MLTRTLTGIAVAGVMLASNAARAEHGRHRGDPEMRLEQIEQRVKQKLAPKLGLDAGTSDRLVEVMRTSARQRIDAMKALHAERRALRELIEGGAPAGELEEQSRRLLEAEAAVPHRTTLLAQTRQLLTSEQQAKLTLMLSSPQQGKGRHGPNHRGPMHDGPRRHGQGFGPAFGSGHFADGG